jgi:hypothetical protein
MNSFYNILKIARDTSSNDSVSIGLLAFSNDKYYLQFSNKKMRIAKSLISDNSDIIDFFQNQMTSRIESLNTAIKSDGSKLFPEKNIYSASYFNYLNRYSNNLVQFSKPYSLSKELNQHDFEKLFHLLIGDDFQSSYQEAAKWQEFEYRVKNNLLDQVKDKVHIYAKLTEKVIPSLYFPYDLDCIGMNGVITAAKSIDFNRNEFTIDKNISHYFQISMLLAKNYSKDKFDNNFYLIADEPEIINSKAHQIWTKLKKQKQFELINSEEVEKVANKIYETKAHKFLDLDIE